MWELKAARDLTPGHTYVIRGDYRASARKINAALNVLGDAVTFTARPLWSRTPSDEAVTLAPDTPVYILNCTCNGMSFIANRWTFTGECSCRHIPLPADKNES